MFVLLRFWRWCLLLCIGIWILNRLLDLSVHHNHQLQPRYYPTQQSFQVNRSSEPARAPSPTGYCRNPPRSYTTSPVPINVHDQLLPPTTHLPFCVCVLTGIALAISSSSSLCLQSQPISVVTLGIINYSSSPKHLITMSSTDQALLIELQVWVNMSVQEQCPLTRKMT